jgi:hypothetical protein
LLFVRRTDILLQRGSAIPRAAAALLGRFLPRLGPLATASGPFFLQNPVNVASVMLHWAFGCHWHATTRFPTGHASCSRHVSHEALLCSWSALLSGGAIGPDLVDGDTTEPVGQHLKIGGKAGEAGAALVAPFVHIKSPIDLELDRVHAG